MRLTRTALWTALAGGALMIFAACGGDDDRGLDVVVDPTQTSDDAEPTSDASETSAPTRPDPTATAEPTVRVTPKPTEDDASGVDDTPFVACHDLLAPLGKDSQLPSDCVPNNLVNLPADYTYNGAQTMTAESATALERMLDDAAMQGHGIYARSTYRSWDEQAWTFQYWVDQDGLEQALRTSARPGHSEHQLGTTADLTSSSVGFALSEGFGDTPEGAWVRENSWRYGFIISYPADTEGITGYAYEPWHIRYVGEGTAADVHASGVTLHEYLRR